MANDFNALAYVLEGRGSVGSDANPIGMGQAAVFGAGDALTIAASVGQDSKSPNLEVMILGGQPIGEPVAWYGPFVMNTQNELHQAVADYHVGKMGVIPADHYMPHTDDNASEE